jgi:hypothetical protein
MRVTRMEIADCVSFVFDQPPASKNDLINAASAVKARPEVLAALQTLPERSYGNLRELWPHLSEVPVAR